MNETLGNIIMRLRKENDLTQEQLANALGITYQAVSKWETGVSSPDISMLPLLADLFGVSIDTLFGRAAPEGEAAAEKTTEAETAPAGVTLPWPDDEDMLHVVLFAGHKLVGADEQGERSCSRRNIEFQYEGPALNIWSDFSVRCGDVQGDVNAGGDVECGDVMGGVNAGGDATCDQVKGELRAGGDVTCDDVMGNISAGGDVTCDDVAGSVSAGGDVTCDTVVSGANAAGIVDGITVDLGEKLSGLGEKISNAVNRSLKGKRRFDRSWSFGDHSVEVHMDLNLSDEDEDE